VILLTAMMIALIWRNEMSDMADPSWTKCKESLLVQTLTGSCTLRYEGETEPS
jgi:hypothetical protein